MRIYSCFLLFLALTFSIQAQQNPVSATKEDNKVYKSVDNPPEFPGGPGELLKHIYENLTYPQEAKDAGIEGTVVVSFVVEKDGAVENVEVRRDIGNGCGAAAAESIKSLPNWKPGEQNGVPARVSFNIPIKFKLDNQKAEVLSDSEKLHRRADFPPSYGQNIADLQQYIDDNLIFPEEAIANNTNGFVTIEFEVQKDGSLKDINIKRDLENGCGVAAKRLFENMPNWNAGYNEKDKPLRVYHTVAIEFDQKKYKKLKKKIDKERK